MKAFISWSGERSHAIAEALHDWLPTVIQAIRPWMSTTDIEKGARWSSDITRHLEESSVGIICLTIDNLESSWVHFEAGALSKTLDKSFVCPYLFDVEPADLKGPLVQFQVARANREDTKKLIHTINRAQGESVLPESKVNKAFEVWWPELEQRLRAVDRSPAIPRPRRSEREILEEILELIRSQLRESGTPHSLSEFETRTQSSLGLTPEETRKYVASAHFKNFGKSEREHLAALQMLVPQERPCRICGESMQLSEELNYFCYQCTHGNSAPA